MASTPHQTGEKDAAPRRQALWLALLLLLALAVTGVFLAWPPLWDGLMAANEKLYEAMQAVAVACRIR